jgi:hypothetical protein
MGFRARPRRVASRLGRTRQRRLASS